MSRHPPLSRTVTTPEAPSPAPLARRPLVQRRCACGGTPGPSGECEACRRKRLQRRTTDAIPDAGATAAPAEPGALGLDPGLEVGPADDAFEREADRVSQRVLSDPASMAPPVAPPGEGAPGAGRKATPGLGAGRPLPGTERRFFEDRLGTDLSRVRVHTGERAARAARGLRAAAFTVGGDIAFGHGQYAPGSSSGRQLLAHELVHTVQQGATGPTAPGSGPVLRRKPMIQRQSFSVGYEECNQSPYSEATVAAAARNVYDTVNGTDCIQDEDFRKAILEEFDGMTIACKQNADGPCGRASRYLSQTVNLFPKALMASSCGPLAATILHEAIHLTEWTVFGHGDLAGGCEKACFNYGSGDAADCTAPAPPVADLALEPGFASLGLPGAGFEASAVAGLPLEPTGRLNAFTGAYSTLVLGLDPLERSAFMAGGLIGLGGSLDALGGTLDVSAEARGGVSNFDLGGPQSSFDPTVLGALELDFDVGRFSAGGEVAAGALFSEADSPQAYFSVGLQLGASF